MDFWDIYKSDPPFDHRALLTDEFGEFLFPFERGDDSPQTICWYSCGAASAVTAKWLLDNHDEPVTIAYCDTSINEHTDNERFLSDCEQWFSQRVLRLRSRRFWSMRIEDVWLHERGLKFVGGAPCTKHLKRHVRREYQRTGDVHMFGFTADESHRLDDFRAMNPDLLVDAPLVDAGITKADCYKIIDSAGIALPELYKLGFNNNNCMRRFACVKGGKGYWNHVRIQNPAAFENTAKMQRILDVAFWKSKGSVPDTQMSLGAVAPGDGRLFLDQLPENAGRHDPPQEIECGVGCDVWGARGSAAQMTMWEDK